MSENDKHDSSQNGFTYYYNRERRLEKAPESVKKAWDEGYLPKNRGFIKGLVGNRGSRSIFITIVVLSVLVVALTLINSKSHIFRTNNFEAQLKAFLYDEAVYVSLSCESKNEIKEELPITLLAIDADNNVVNSSEIMGEWNNQKLIVRTTFIDYSIARIQAQFVYDATNVTLISIVDRN